MCDFFLYLGMGLTFSRNIDNNRVYPFFRYTLTGYNLYQINTGTPCKLNHWNDEKKKITRGDKNYISKNNKISALRTKLEYIVNRYKNNDELLTPKLLRLEINKREFQKEESSVKTLPLLSLIEEWEQEYKEDKQINDRTQSKTESVIKDIKSFIQEIEQHKSKVLLIDDLNDTFNRELLSWLFDKPNRTGGKLQPYTVSRRFRYLQTFCNWYSRRTKEYIKVKIPKELSDALRASDEESPLCFYQKELEKLVEFKGFNFEKPIEKGGKTVYVESDIWKKYLNKDRRNRNKKSGVVEFLSENTKEGTKTYTSWEVYKDFLVFLCSTGCRYGDGINMKVGDYKHGKRNNSTDIRDGLDGLFKYKQIKTNRLATPRINAISIEIYRKYSYGKKNGDYLFPRTKKGNIISDIKINKHLKSICNTIGLNRKVEKINLGSKGVELSNEKKELWELVSTHIGRRTYIKTMVLKREYSIKEIMKMTGHKNQNVFNAYYSIEDKDLLKRENKPFIQKGGLKKNVINSPHPKQKKDKTLTEKLAELEEAYNDGHFDKQKWEEQKDKLLNSL
jgi:integrase